ncbi:transferase, Chloramphenicol acetyltransferase-like domain protein [Artemisia annua]|uniref:Transferase, Chloramphenicol acetyltransferase-like domain protein n=1 Tax=Artemisia annua TaxID=35608 RepID=A0A2U1Q410_ARTAN|nr:transferase, Chloramphenicol acetyltransferase-like domain protein [Artemisia annua]
MSHDNFSQQFSDVNNFSQQFPENTANTPPTDIIPVFPTEEEPVEEQQDNPFQLTEEQQRLLAQDEKVLREMEENAAREEAVRREQEAREAEYRYKQHLVRHLVQRKKTNALLIKQYQKDEKLLRRVDDEVKKWRRVARINTSDNFTKDFESSSDGFKFILYELIINNKINTKKAFNVVGQTLFHKKIRFSTLGCIKHMASSPTFTVLQESQVSPPRATIADVSLALTYFDTIHLLWAPIHYLFFYELPLITKTHFLETIAPNLEQSLSITLQHFFPFVGNLIVFNNSNKLPEISYFEGDSVKVTFGECNLDFNNLTRYHPRNCDKFYHLIPRLAQYVKLPDYVKIPVFSLQVTFFPNRGISIGMSSHHSLGDASTHFSFLKAWTSIARHGKAESFLANGTLPLYERYPPTLDESYLNRMEIVGNILIHPYQVAYFGNCVLASITTETTSVLSADDGFITAVKLIGENLHKMLTDKDGVVKHKIQRINALFTKEFVPKMMIGVSGSPKLNFYDLDFGWGKPKKIETISIDYSNSISVHSSKESNEDLDIGVCLTDTGMQAFARIFNEELEHLAFNSQTTSEDPSSQQEAACQSDIPISSVGGDDIVAGSSAVEANIGTDLRGENQATNVAANNPVLVDAQQVGIGSQKHFARVSFAILVILESSKRISNSNYF